MRKSAQIKALEEHYQKPLAAIVAAAYTEHQTIEATAAALTRESGIEINPNTLAYWLVRLPIKVDVRKVASVNAPVAAAS